jgi:hypothetical protein
MDSLRGNDFRKPGQVRLRETGQVGWPDPDLVAQTDVAVVAEQLQHRPARVSSEAAPAPWLGFVP